MNEQERLDQGETGAVATVGALEPGDALDPDGHFTGHGITDEWAAAVRRVAELEDAEPDFDGWDSDTLVDWCSRIESILAERGIPSAQDVFEERLCECHAAAVLALEGVAGAERAVELLRGATPESGATVAPPAPASHAPLSPEGDTDGR